MAQHLCTWKDIFKCSFTAACDCTKPRFHISFHQMNGLRPFLENPLHLEHPWKINSCGNRHAHTDKSIWWCVKNEERTISPSSTSWGNLPLLFIWRSALYEALAILRAVWLIKSGHKRLMHVNFSGSCHWSWSGWQSIFVSFNIRMKTSVSAVRSSLNSILINMFFM